MSVEWQMLTYWKERAEKAEAENAKLRQLARELLFAVNAETFPLRVKKAKQILDLDTSEQLWKTMQKWRESK